MCWSLKRTGQWPSVPFTGLCVFTWWGAVGNFAKYFSVCYIPVYWDVRFLKTCYHQLITPPSQLKSKFHTRENWKSEISVSHFGFWSQMHSIGGGCLRSEDIWFITSVLMKPGVHTFLCFLHAKVPADVCVCGVITLGTSVFVVVLCTPLHMFHLLSLFLLPFMRCNWLFFLIIYHSSYPVTVQLVTVRNVSIRIWVKYKVSSMIFI